MADQSPWFGTSSLNPNHVLGEEAKHCHAYSRKAAMATGPWQGLLGGSGAPWGKPVCVALPPSRETAGLTDFLQRESLGRLVLLYFLAPEYSPVLGLPEAWRSPCSKITEPQSMRRHSAYSDREMEWKESVEATSWSLFFTLKFFSLDSDTTCVVCLKLDLKGDQLS